MARTAGINPIDPTTGKRYRGRWRAEWGPRPDTGHPRIHDDDESNSDGGDDTPTPTPGDDTPATGTPLSPANESITVEGVSRPILKPKKEPSKPASSRKPKAGSGAFTPQFVERTAVTVFGMLAMWRNAGHWAIHHPDIEVRPWAGSAAELLNKIPQETAEKITDSSAALSVIVGVGSLVGMRLRMDAEIRMHAARAKRAQLQREEGIPDVNPDAPAQPANGRATVPGSGAAPVHPEEPIFGEAGGLS